MWFLCLFFCCRPLDELPLREIGAALDDPFDDEEPQVYFFGWTFVLPGYVERKKMAVSFSKKSFFYWIYRRVAKTHRILYLHRSFSAKVTYI